MINQLIKTFIQITTRLIMHMVTVVCFLVNSINSFAQPQKEISIEQCHTLARQNYPLIRQQELIAKSREYSVSNLSKGYLPQLSVNGQATYQSDVTQVPIRLPNVNISEISKDQYKLYAELNQVVYDGGTISTQKKIQEAATAVEGQKLEVELYKIRERINQLYFGILLLQEQLVQAGITNKDLEAALKRTEASYANGTALKSNVELLKAELLKLKQRTIELNTAVASYKEMLGFFTGLQLDESTKLMTPGTRAVSNEVNRPELKLFEYQDKQIDVQQSLVSMRNRPKISLFLQGGYGRPALNMLSNDFESYYIGGVRLNWNLSGLYSLSNEKLLLDLNRRNIAVQKNTFLFNTTFSIKQQDAEISRLNQLLVTDEEMIVLRSSIKNASAAQLANGVIATSDYIREVNAEDMAIQNKLTHQIQLLMAQYAHQLITGN